LWPAAAGSLDKPVNINPRMAKLAGGVLHLDGQLMPILDIDRVVKIAAKRRPAVQLESQAGDGGEQK